MTDITRGNWPFCRQPINKSFFATSVSFQCPFSALSVPFQSTFRADLVSIDCTSFSLRLDRIPKCCRDSYHRSSAVSEHFQSTFRTFQTNTYSVEQYWAEACFKQESVSCNYNRIKLNNQVVFIVTHCQQFLSWFNPRNWNSIDVLV